MLFKLLHTIELPLAQQTHELILHWVHPPLPPVHNHVLVYSLLFLFLGFVVPLRILTVGLLVIVLLVVCVLIMTIAMGIGSRCSSLILFIFK